MTKPQVIEHESRAVATQTGQALATTPMDMLDRALAQGASPEILEKFMGLHERWEKNQARKAFDEAVSLAKAEIKPIVRNSTGHNSKKYADMAAVANAVDPIITKHGLSYRHRAVQNERINVTCILSHKLGHSEETTLAGPADKTGNKNDIQAIGSTLTYLQRYSLMLALGLAAGKDDDGKAAEDGHTISDAQLQKLIAIADDVGADKIKFCRFLKIEALADLPASRFADACAALEAKRVTK